MLQASDINGKEISLSSPLIFDTESLQAKEGEVKIPTFKMLANTGVPMRVRGFYDPVIVSMKGAKFAKSVTPIIMDHDVSLRLGHSTSQSIDKDRNEIVLQGQVSSSSQAAKDFVADAKAGIPFESSIGAIILDSTYVPEGKSVTVNGKEWKGPLTVANRIKIREVSATLLGADGETETKVAASSKGKTMDPELKAFIEGLGLDASTISDEQMPKLKNAHENLTKLKASVSATQETEKTDPVADSREKLALESERVDAINAKAKEYAEEINDEHKFSLNGKEYVGLNKFKAAALRSDIDANSFELHLLRARRADGVNQPGIISHTGDLENDVIEAVIARKMGLSSGRNRWVAPCGGFAARQEVPSYCQGREYGLEAYYKPDILEKTHDRKYDGVESIQALFDVAMRACGKTYRGIGHNTDSFAAAAVEAYTFIRSSGFSTLNVPNILENLMHKFALAAFDSQEQTWRAITARKPLQDFRPHNMYRLNWDGHFRQVDQQGQLSNVSMKDSKYTVQADTFGAVITIDRKTIRNDDLGQITAKATTIGMLGAMRIEQSIYTLLLSNPGAFFSSTLGNLITGSTSALNQTGASTPASPAGLDQARRSFRNQVINGYPIGISPKILLVGTSQETQAYQLWAQETFAVAGVSGTVDWLLNKNEFQGMYRPVVTPYLNNTSLTDDEGNALSGQSNTQWYLFTEPNIPQGSALVIGFLDGRDQPYFDQADTQFNVPGGIQFRSYLDWGVAMNVPQLGLKSAGA